MSNVMQMLTEAVRSNASDIFVVAGLPVTFKVYGRMVPFGPDILTPSTTEEIVREIYSLAYAREIDRVFEQGDDDFSVALPGLSRFRVNVYRQRSTLAVVIRIITWDLPAPEDIGIPEVVMGLAAMRRGLVLVTGTAGSGKSTTLACLIDRINRTRTGHIITLEDPLEYLHPHDRSIVSQREISTDADSYVRALRSALRQSPDVILLGEMRDHEAISVAMTAAETGHLVLSTLHTVGAASTIDRVIDAFPSGQQNQIRLQLSMVLQAVVSQQLIPSTDGNIVPAFEILMVNSAVRNMIRESKIHQVDTIIQASAPEGMVSMDASLLDLYRSGAITGEDALLYSIHPDLMSKKLGR